MNSNLNNLKSWATKKWQNKWIKAVVISICAVFVFIIGLYISIYFGAFGKIPTEKELSSITQEEATELLDRNGKLIGKYYIYDRQPVEFNTFPKHLIYALVATEDVRFYEHDGIDNVSLMRVFIKNLILRDKSAGGGSTITLQLAKNLYGRKDYAIFSMLINKFKESIIAKRLESVYSKNEILTLYLNTVTFSDNTYGIESASQKFFNKSVSELSQLESATLVGTLKANSYFNPRLHLERSKSRRNVVLNQMTKYGYLSKDSIRVLKDKDLDLEYRSFNHDVGLAPYFRETVKQQLNKILDTIKKPDGSEYNLYKDGLRVSTTLDYAMQNYAESAMREHLAQLQNAFEKSYGENAPWEINKQLIKSALQRTAVYKSLESKGLTKKQIEDSLNVTKNIELFSWEGDTIQNISTIDSLKHFLKFLNTGLLSIDPNTGAVRAYIGGINYKYFKYDHVSQSKRQVGSTFKPFVYTAAIEDGMNPCEYFSLSKVTYTNYDDWTPSNAGGEKKDPYLNYNLEYALSNSINTIAVKIFDKVGIPKVINQVKKLGITEELPRAPSLALGVAEINLMSLTGAYASYVNNSKPVEPFFITTIEDKSGKIIYEFQPENSSEEAFSVNTRQIMLQMMKATVNSGTASRIRDTYKLDNAIAGKTGTTQNNKDGWFVGITPKLVTVIWVGNDNYSIGFNSTALGQGANSAIPIFAKYYKRLSADKEFYTLTNAPFETPSKEVLEALDCEPEKRDGFFRRLFKRKKKKKKFN